jgi:hypothetical protein
VDRTDLARHLEQELDKWSAKSYESLRLELKGHDYADAEGAVHHVEVTLLEDGADYVHVGISVCSPAVPWSCIHPVSTSFLLYKDGRVDKPVL